MNMPDVHLFFNRDLSWLKFNERVLHQAQDPKTPLLERVRFLAIYSTNLDEFFMKRVGYLKRILSHSAEATGFDMFAPAQLLSEIHVQVQNQLLARYECYQKQIIPELKNNGIHLLSWNDLGDDEKKIAKEYFQEKVFPVLTPLAVDMSHPFPFLSNLSLSLGIMLKHPKKNETYFARLKIPDVLPQWVQIISDQKIHQSNTYRFIRLSDLISANLDELFPKMLVLASVPFRVTRNADIGDISDDVEDRLDMVEEELRLRRIAEIVRFEQSSSLENKILQFLLDELELTAVDFYDIPGELGYESLYEIANLNIAELRYPTHLPIKPRDLKEEGRDIFSVLREKSLLVSHPYESFSDSVERFVREAARDPNVLAIKITLYRAGENNPIIPMLIMAAERGKQVVCVVELKARFDEARNIYWGEMLEKAGVHVIYGVIGKKIHSKTILVIRKEGNEYRYYSHLGTGNYNPNTAKMYTDLSYLTADKKIGQELIEVFNFLTGLSLKKNYQKLLVAPVNMRNRFINYIKKEIEFKKDTGEGHIIAKMNSLEDQEICDALYKASQEGVKIDLLVRGFCTLRPGVKQLSENIKVSSCIGRFLEHSRIYYFRHGAKTPVAGLFYIGSADWMYRNLNNRIETVVPIDSERAKNQCWHILQEMLTDKAQTWDLQEDGQYILRKSDKTLGVHEELIKYYLKVNND